MISVFVVLCILLSLILAFFGAVFIYDSLDSVIGMLNSDDKRDRIYEIILSGGFILLQMLNVVFLTHYLLG